MQNLSRQEKIQKAIEAAREVAAKAYAPYSHFHVGAALLATDGQFYTGCNVENSIYEAIICGERSAIASAVTSGAALKDPAFIDIIVVTCLDLPSRFDIHGASPCGACRQVIREFSDCETKIVVDDRKKGHHFLVKEMLPMGFRLTGTALKQDCSYEAGRIDQIEAVAVATETTEKMFSLVQRVAAHSYVPFSGQETGAILLTTDGRAFAGARVENSSTGLTINADRVAVSRAVAAGAALHGQKFIKAMFMAETGPRKIAHRFSMARPNSFLLDEFAVSGTLVGVLTPNGGVLKKYTPQFTL